MRSRAGRNRSYVIEATRHVVPAITAARIYHDKTFSGGFRFGCERNTATMQTPDTMPSEVQTGQRQSQQERGTRRYSGTKTSDTGRIKYSEPMATTHAAGSAAKVTWPG